MVQLARREKLYLHAHSDIDALERLFKQDPQARILWAHAGFERPEAVREMLRKHRNLWCDLAFRSDHGSGGKVAPEWRAAFLEFPERFLVGTDTFTPERWHYIAEHANWSRAWLADLPREVAERIAWKNGEALFGAAVLHAGAHMPEHRHGMNYAPSVRLE
jgi:predicted TIM-barrel fold metal-dependent hydrolase